jgi:ABC-type uncharacterized transport system auxiliary subunit
LKNKPKIALAGLAFLLNGCVSLKDNAPVPTQYRIQAQHISTNAKALPYTITVGKPDVVSWLNTNRVALTLQNGRVLDYFSGAQWSGRLDTVLEVFIVESLSRDYEVVLESTHGVNKNADYKLMTRVINYQAEYPKSPTTDLPELNITLVVTLIRSNDGVVVKQMRISNKQKATSNTLMDITDVLENMLQDAFAEIQESLRQLIIKDMQAIAKSN